MKTKHQIKQILSSHYERTRWPNETSLGSGVAVNSMVPSAFSSLFLFLLLDSIRRELIVTNYFRLLVSVENWNKRKSFIQTSVSVAAHDALSCSYLDALHESLLQQPPPSSETTTVFVHLCVALCVVKVIEEGWQAHSLHQPHTDLYATLMFLARNRQRSETSAYWSLLKAVANTVSLSVLIMAKFLHKYMKRKLQCSEEF